MDIVPEFGSDRDRDADYDLTGSEIAVEPPPPAIGQDERRMQVRAYNFWAGLLEEGHFPAVDSLLAGKMPDFADHSVLLHFDTGMDDPGIAYLGAVLAGECEGGDTIRRLSDVPGRSLLSRITDHYLQIIANQAPIGFEAEFVNQRGSTVLYRGILLPFSSDATNIDYIYGAINWKELADQRTTDELLLEIGQSLDEPTENAPKRRLLEPLAEWADGPATLDLAEFGAEIVPFPGMFADDENAAPLPDPVFGAGDAANDADLSLADWLASARDLAQVANSSEDRTRSALYAAIGRAWDFALATQEAPQDYADMISDAGLTIQERAPLTPLVKLVFGADYDKTRLTEFTTALGHAERLGLKRGELGSYLAASPGGLKGVVALERQMRREEAGKGGKTAAVVLADDLRAMPARSLANIAAEGTEFALVMVRRLPEGGVALVGEIPPDLPLFERAARRLIG